MTSIKIAVDEDYNGDKEFEKRLESFKSKKPYSNLSGLASKTTETALVPDHEEETIFTKINQAVEDTLFRLAKNNKQYIADKEKEFYEVSHKYCYN